VSEFLEDVPEGTPGHGDEFVRGESARARGESALERDPRTDTRWLVVDESLPRPELQAALRDALTWPRGALASALPALVGVAATLGGVVGVAVAVGGLDLVEWPSWAGLGSVGAAAAGITAYGVLGWHAHERAAARRRAATRVARAAVVEVPAAFAGWARAEGRTLRHDDLVALARALSATRAAASTLDAWRRGEPDVDWPHADSVVDPVLVGEYVAARAALDELAARHGWTVPAEVAPESLR